MLRAAADYREMVRDVLGVHWFLGRGSTASRCDPADSVSTTRQRPHEEVVPLLSAWTQDQLGHTSVSSAPNTLPGGSCTLKIGDWLPEAPVKNRSGLGIVKPSISH